MLRGLSCPVQPHCLNGTLLGVDFMDVTMGDIPSQDAKGGFSGRPCQRFTGGPLTYCRPSTHQRTCGGVQGCCEGPSEIQKHGARHGRVGGPDEFKLLEVLGVVMAGKCQAALGLRVMCGDDVHKGRLSIRGVVCERVVLNVPTKSLHSLHDMLQANKYMLTFEPVLGLSGGFRERTYSHMFIHMFIQSGDDDHLMKKSRRKPTTGKRCPQARIQDFLQGGVNDGRVLRAPLASAPTGGLGLINIRLRYIASIEYSERFFLIFFFWLVKKFVEKQNWWSRAGGGHDPQNPPPGSAPGPALFDKWHGVFL